MCNSFIFIIYNLSLFKKIKLYINIDLHKHINIYSGYSVPDTILSTLQFFFDTLHVLTHLMKTYDVVTIIFSFYRQNS